MSSGVIDLVSDDEIEVQYTLLDLCSDDDESVAPEPPQQQTEPPQPQQEQWGQPREFEEEKKEDASKFEAQKQQPSEQSEQQEETNQEKTNGIEKERGTQDTVKSVVHQSRTPQKQQQHEKRKEMVEEDENDQNPTAIHAKKQQQALEQEQLMEVEEKESKEQDPSYNYTRNHQSQPQEQQQQEQEREQLMETEEAKKNEQDCTSRITTDHPQQQDDVIDESTVIEFFQKFKSVVKKQYEPDFIFDSVGDGLGVEIRSMLLRYPTLLQRKCPDNVIDEYYESDDSGSDDDEDDNQGNNENGSSQQMGKFPKKQHPDQESIVWSGYIPTECICSMKPSGFNEHLLCELLLQFGATVTAKCYNLCVLEYDDDDGCSYTNVEYMGILMTMSNCIPEVLFDNPNYKILDFIVHNVRDVTLLHDTVFELIYSNCRNHNKQRNQKVQVGVPGRTHVEGGLFDRAFNEWRRKVDSDGQAALHEKENADKQVQSENKNAEVTGRDDRNLKVASLSSTDSGGTTYDDADNADSSVITLSVPPTKKAKTVSVSSSSLVSDNRVIAPPSPVRSFITISVERLSEEEEAEERKLQAKRNDVGSQGTILGGRTVQGDGVSNVTVGNIDNKDGMSSVSSPSSTSSSRTSSYYHVDEGTPMRRKRNAGRPTQNTKKQKCFSATKKKTISKVKMARQSFSKYDAKKAKACKSLTVRPSPSSTLAAKAQSTSASTPVVSISRNAASYTSVRIEQIDPNTMEVLAVHNSALEANAKMGITDPNRKGAIPRACCGIQKKAFGFLWRYAKADNNKITKQRAKKSKSKMSRIANHKKKAPMATTPSKPLARLKKSSKTDTARVHGKIRMINPETGKVVREFANVIAAAKHIGVAKKQIYNVLNGHQKTSGNYFWT